MNCLAVYWNRYTIHFHFHTSYLQYKVNKFNFLSSYITEINISICLQFQGLININYLTQTLNQIVANDIVQFLLICELHMKLQSLLAAA